MLYLDQEQGKEANQERHLRRRQTLDRQYALRNPEKVSPASAALKAQTESLVQRSVAGTLAGTKALSSPKNTPTRQSFTGLAAGTAGATGAGKGLGPTIPQPVKRVSPGLAGEAMNRKNTIEANIKKSGALGAQLLSRTRQPETATAATPKITLPNYASYMAIEDNPSSDRWWENSENLTRGYLFPKGNISYQNDTETTIGGIDLTKQLTPEEKYRAKQILEQFYSQFPKDTALGLGYSDRTKEIMTQHPNWRKIRVLESKLQPGTAIATGLAQSLGVDHLIRKIDELDGQDTGSLSMEAASSQNPTAVKGGSLAGELIKLSGANRFAHGATGLIPGFSTLSPLVQSMLQSGTTMGTVGAYDAAIEGGDAKEVAAAAGRNFAGGVVGSGLSGKILSLGNDLLFRYGLQNSRIANMVLSGLGGTAFSLGNTGTNVAINTAVDPNYEMDAEQVTQDAIAAFLFSAISSYVNTIQSSAQNKARMEQLNRQVQETYGRLIQKSTAMTPAEQRALQQQALEANQKLRSFINGNKFVGAGQEISELNRFLNMIDDGINGTLIPEGYLTGGSGGSAHSPVPGISPVGPSSGTGILSAGDVNHASGETNLTGQLRGVAGTAGISLSDSLTPPAQNSTMENRNPEYQSVVFESTQDPVTGELGYENHVDGVLDSLVKKSPGEIARYQTQIRDQIALVDNYINGIIDQYADYIYNYQPNGVQIIADENGSGYRASLNESWYRKLAGGKKLSRQGSRALAEEVIAQGLYRQFPEIVPSSVMENIQLTYQGNQQEKARYAAVFGQGTPTRVTLDNGRYIVDYTPAERNGVSGREEKMEEKAGLPRPQRGAAGLYGAGGDPQANRGDDPRGAGELESGVLPPVWGARPGGYAGGDRGLEETFSGDGRSIRGDVPDADRPGGDRLRGADVAGWTESRSGDRLLQFHSEDAIRETINSPAFRAKNPDGSPMTVYHGTNASFDRFRPGKTDLGIHFGNEDQARSILREKGGSRMIRAHLELNNPLYVAVDVFGQRGMEGYFEDILTTGDLSDSEIAYIQEHSGSEWYYKDQWAECRNRKDEELLWGNTDKAAQYMVEAERYEALAAEKHEQILQQAKANLMTQGVEVTKELLSDEMANLNNRALEADLKALGYDGITYPNDYEGKGLSYAVFDPEQVAIYDDGRGPSAFQSGGAKPDDAVGIVSPELLELGEAVSAVKSTGRAVYQDLISAQSPLERMHKNQRKATGDSSIDAVTQMSRQAGGTVDYIIEKGLVDRDGNTLAGSYRDLIGSIPQEQLDEYNDYAQNLHNIDRQKQGKPVNRHTAEESLEIVRQYEQKYPAFRQYANEISAWWDTFGQKWLVESGLISQPAYDAMREMYPHYIPTFRVGKMPGGSGVYGRTVQTPKTVKKAKGGTSEIIPLEESFAAQINRTVKAVRYNELGQTLLDYARQNPQQAAKDGISLSQENGGSLELDGWDALLDSSEQKALKEVRNGEYTLTVYENGQPVNLNISRDVWNAMRYLRDNGLSEDWVQNWVRVGRFWTGWSKTGITGVNALFAATNTLRDIQTYWINSISNNPIELGKNYLLALLNVLSEDTGFSRHIPEQVKNSGVYRALDRSDAYREYQALGGSRSGYYGQRAGFKKSVENHLPFSQKSTAEKAKAAVGAPFQAFAAMGEFTEKIPRMAEYLNARSRYGDTPEGRRKAAFAAADVTVNFSRSAPTAKILDAWTLYLNAQIQGMDKLARQVKNRPAATLSKGLMIVTLPTLLLLLINRDNPHYNDLDDRTKDGYFVIPNLSDLDENGNAKTFYKVPKSREFGAILGAGLERTARYVIDHDPEAFQGYWNTVKTSFLPSNAITDNYWSPFVVNLPNNKDYAGRTIVPQALLDASPEYQYDINTSGAARQITGVFNRFNDALPFGELPEWLRSPMQFDYLIDTFAGYPGQMVQSTTSPQNLGNTPSETLTNAAQRALIEPFERRFTADPLYQSAVTDRFYNAYDEAKRAAADRNLRENIPSDAVTPEEKARGVYAKAAAEIADLRRQEKAMLAAPGSYEDKQRMADEIRMQINAAAANAVVEAKKVLEESSQNYIQEISSLSEQQQEKARELKSKGIDYQIYLDFTKAAGQMEADRDREGNAIAGTKKQKVYDWIKKQSGLTRSQKKALFEAGGYRAEGQYSFY